MNRTGARFVAVAFLAAATAGACANGPAAASPQPTPAVSDTRSGTSSEPSVPPLPATLSALDAQGDQLHIRVAYVGGIAPGRFGSVPEASVLGDRRVITVDQVGGPPPALTELSARTLDPAARQRLQQAGVRAGLADGYSDDSASPDAQSVLITFEHGGRAHRSTFSNLSPQESDSPELAERRAAVSAFVEGLRDLERYVGPTGVGEAEPFAPERVAIAVRPAPQSSGGAVKDWPSSEVRLAELSRAGACVVLDGSRADAVVAALTGEDAATLWRDDGQIWQLRARPLLPDQTSCR